MEDPAIYYTCVCRTIREALLPYDVQTLAAWWAALNCWEWPETCVIPKPLGWDAARLFVKRSDTEIDHSTPNKATLMDPLMLVLQSLIPFKAALHAAWQRDGKTTEAFEAWWAIRDKAPWDW